MLARTLAGAAGLAVVAAGVVVATAPAVSQAELAVEQGQAMIAVQAAATAQDGSDGAEPAGTKADRDGSTASGGKQGAKGGEKTAEEPADRPAMRARITGDQISAFGDSVLSGAAPALFEKFPGIAIDGEPIRKWVDAPAIIEAADRRGEIRDVVVLQFGTNGGFAWAGAEESLDQILDLLGPDRDVVLVATVGVSDWVPSTNERLDQIAAERDNVWVAPWDDVVRDHPGLLHADRTHPNVEGTYAYAKVLKQTLAQID